MTDKFNLGAALAADQEKKTTQPTKRNSKPEAIYDDVLRYWDGIKSGAIKFIAACSLFNDKVEAWVRHHINFIGGYTSAGKSTILAQIIIAAARLEAEIVVFSLEDSREEKFMTIIAVMTGIHKRKLVMGKLSEDEERIVGEAAAEIMSWNLRIYDDVWTLSEMEEIIKSNEVDIIAIDYIQNVFIRGMQKIYDRMCYASQELFRFASAYNACFIILSQSSNESARNESDVMGLKGAGELAAIANSVLWLSKGRKEENKRKVTLSIRKNKTFGPCGDIDLEYSEDWTRLERVPEIPTGKSIHEDRLNERRLSNEQ